MIHSINPSGAYGAAQDGGEELKKLSVQLPRAVHQQLKVFAIRNDTSITNVIQKLVDDLLMTDQQR